MAYLAAPTPPGRRAFPAVALLVALCLASPSAAGAAPARALPSGGDLHAPFLVSDFTDEQEEGHLGAASDGGAVLAVWETDDRHGQASPDQGRLEFCQASFLVDNRWSNPFPVSVVNGTAVEGHFSRVAAADGHFLTTCLLVDVNGFVVAYIDRNATYPLRSFVIEAALGSVLGRPSPAGWGGGDFVAAIETTGPHGPPGGQAALVFPLPPSSGPVGAPEVAWSGANLTLRDLVLVNASGRLALVVEFAHTSNGPSQVGVLFRAGPSDWGPLVPLTASAADRSHRQLHAVSDRGRLLVTFERQRAAESLVTEVAFLDVGADGSVTRDLAVSPPSSSASHEAPALVVFHGRATVAWETNDDGLSPGGHLASFCRTVDGAAPGDIVAISPPGDTGANGPARLVTDGARLFGLWVSDSPAVADGPDLDIVGRYLGGDFDRDGLLDAVDATPAGEPPLNGGGGGPPPAGPGIDAALVLSGVAGAGVGAAAALMPPRRRRRGAHRP